MPEYFAAGPRWATSPKPVSSYQALQSFLATNKDAIIVSLDFETVDHFKHDEVSKYCQASELGVSVFDPRLAPYSRNTFDQLAQHIEATHFIDYAWSLVHEEACRCHPPNHPRKRHFARPYHSQFTKSTYLTKIETMWWLHSFFWQLVRQNRTNEEFENDKQRSVKILFWDHRLEQDILDEGGVDFSWLGDDIELWDLQTWSLFEHHFFPEPWFADDGEMIAPPRVNCGRALASLGISGGNEQSIREGREHGIVFHNAANDTVAQVLSWLRFMKMTEEEWHKWYDEGDNLPSICLDWIDHTIYMETYAKRLEVDEEQPPPSPFPLDPWADISSKQWKEQWEKNPFW